MDRPEFLTRLLEIPPDRPALHFADTDRSTTYGELLDGGARVAGWLHERGVKPGDRVGIQLDNGLPLVLAHLGCMALGAVRVPLNRHYKAVELAPILEDATPRLVIAEDPSLFPGLDVHPEPGLGPPLRAWPSPPADVTAWLFTSGTTGRPKGAPQTFRMWTANLDSLAEAWQFDSNCRLWLMLPMFHTNGLVLGLHGTLLRGASARISAHFSPAPPPPDVTDVYGVPTFYHRWIPTMAAQPDAFRRLRLMVSGSDGLGAAVSDEAFRLTGQRVLERYGMTETVMICSNPYAGERRAGTVGLPLPGVALRISEGEVQVQGPSVFDGYHPRPDAEAFTTDGWFRTGDAGELDEAGYLRLVGRKKDLVIVGGVNVSPAEVEGVIRGVPGVADVGCCGLPDEDLGEVVVAAIVPDRAKVDGPQAEAELLAAVARAGLLLSGLKRPRQVVLVGCLPRNALGKLQRNRMAQELFGQR